MAIYSHVVDASGQCWSVSLILGFNLDFSFCDNLVSFYKSSHIILSLLLVNFCNDNFCDSCVAGWLLKNWLQQFGAIEIWYCLQCIKIHFIITYMHICTYHMTGNLMWNLIWCFDNLHTNRKISINFPDLKDCHILSFHQLISVIFLFGSYSIKFYFCNYFCL